MIITTVQIRCDDCGTLFKGRGRMGAQVRLKAREAEWQVAVNGGRDYCPKHIHTVGRHYGLENPLGSKRSKDEPDQ